MAQPPKDTQAKMRQMADEERIRKQLKAQYDAEMAKRYSRDIVPFAQWMSDRNTPGMADGGQRTLPRERREQNLAKFLEPSAEKRRMYHGTRSAGTRSVSKPGQQGIEEFKHGLRGMTFVSPDPEFANSYAGAKLSSAALESGAWTPTMYPVHVQVKNPFDYENPEHIEGILPHLPFGTDYKWSIVHNKTPDEMREALKSGNWDILEDGDVVEAIRNAGHDAMYMKEAGVKNLGVFDPSAIKSATGNRGTYSRRSKEINKADGGPAKAPNMDTMRLALTNGMYSPLEKAAMSVPRTKGTAQEFMTETMKQPGFRKEELEDRPISLPEGKLTREQFVSHLKAHPHKKILVDVRHSDDDETHHDEYTLPGGENYREVLLKAPAWKGDDRIMEKEAKLRREEHPMFREMLQRELDELKASKAKHGEVFPGNPHHFGGEPGILASLRLKDRIGPNGEKILHVEEIQSDWHQEGRKKGYAQAETSRMKGTPVDAGDGTWRVEWPDGTFSGGYAEAGARAKAEEGKGNAKVGVPDAPHKKSWHELALKHALTEANKGGYHGIAITPGEQQADRYDLSKQIEMVTAYKETGGGYRISATDLNGNTLPAQKAKDEHELENLVGKELASKIASQKSLVDQYTGLDLKVGGEGMKGFYDKILVDALNKIGKKHGAQVAMHSVPVTAPKSKNADADDQLLNELGVQVPTVAAPKLHYFPITPSLRQQIKSEGLPQYKAGGQFRK